jgi:hypothetical protein
MNDDRGKYFMPPSRLFGNARSSFTLNKRTTIEENIYRRLRRVEGTLISRLCFAVWLVPSRNINSALPLVPLFSPAAGKKP